VGLSVAASTSKIHRAIRVLKLPMERMISTAKPAATGSLSAAPGIPRPGPPKNVCHKQADAGSASTIPPSATFQKRPRTALSAGVNPPVASSQIGIVRGGPRASPNSTRLAAKVLSAVLFEDESNKCPVCLAKILMGPILA